MTIQTERLALRPMRQEDLAGLQEMLFDERVMYAYEHRFTPEDAQAWLLRQQRRYREDGFGLWAMVERQSGEMVGQAGITWQDCEGERVLEIGYLLQYRHWHKGFASEAAAACRDYAFEKLGAARVHSIIKEDNFASQRVARRVGMRPVKSFLATYYNGPVRHILYALNRPWSGQDRRGNPLLIRDCREQDWEAIARIHDEARKQELALAGLQQAFLPLEIAAKREGLLNYPGLFVAETGGEVAGFAACSEEELAWLYVDPSRARRGIGQALCRYALQAFPGIHTVEVLKGNEPARKLYESLGFSAGKTLRGRMPGNEQFAVEVYQLTK